MKPKAWERLAAQYPLKKVFAAICGICKFGARIDYESIREKPIIHPNLSTVDTDTHLLTLDIVAEASMNRFLVYPNKESLPAHFTASPLGLVEKADGSKRRIHHLSYPAIGSDSINAGIPEHYGTISYSTIHDAILAVQEMGRNCILVKQDFESAFRHIPVSPLDSPLLGFKWQGIHYSECFLPFGLRTAPYLFNLFAEVFHWIVEDQLWNEGLHAWIIHYLDDFLIILPPGSKLERHIAIFERLCKEVGLSIKEAKNEEGTMASFAGIELDTREMVIRLPAKKQHKAESMIEAFTIKR